MAFKRWQGKRRRASREDVRINAKGRVYIPSFYNFEGRYELLWDEERLMIGLHPQPSGTRKSTPCKDGVIVSFKSMLDELDITYPQICKTSFEGEILTLIVEKSQADNA